MRLTKWIMGALLSASLIGPVQPAVASGPGVYIVDAKGAKDTKKVEAIRLEMLVVHATTANKAVDPQVRPLIFHKIPNCPR